MACLRWVAGVMGRCEAEFTSGSVLRSMTVVSRDGLPAMGCWELGRCEAEPKSGRVVGTIMVGLGDGCPRMD